ncbi:MAG: hypothetical protein K6G50_14045 [bacterium]|nr:hypothetical protein [bacterium]
MTATDFLLQGGYVRLLMVHFLAAAIFSLIGIFYALRVKPWRDTLIFAALIALGSSAFLSKDAPQVYYDEFFYVSVAANMKTRLCAEPLIWQDMPPHVREMGFFQPPYPQGWPFLLSLGLSTVKAPEPGTHEEPIWKKALLPSRCLHLLMPGLLYLFLRRRFDCLPSALAALLFIGLPLERLLAGCAAAESGALFCLLVVCLAYEELRCGRKVWQLLWLYLAASALAEMRPEAMIPAFGAAALGTFNMFGKTKGKNIWLSLALCAVFFLPPFIVMGSHDASLDHHFQSVPRAGYTMMQNRLANLGGNAMFFVSDKIWPAGITVLALIGIIGTWRKKSEQPEEMARNSETETREEAETESSQEASAEPGTEAERPEEASAEPGTDDSVPLQDSGTIEPAYEEVADNCGFTKVTALFCMTWVLGITALLSMFPFGDYECLNSIDTWRYSWHIAVPMLMAACAGIAALSDSEGNNPRARRAILALILAACFIPLFTSPIITKPHPLERLRSICESGTRDLTGYVVSNQPEYYAFLRFGLGLPAVLAPISELPETETALLWDVSEDGTGVPHLDLWERFDLEPLVYEGNDVPQAGVFIIRRRGDDL